MSLRCDQSKCVYECLIPVHLHQDRQNLAFWTKSHPYLFLNRFERLLCFNQCTRNNIDRKKRRETDYSMKKSNETVRRRRLRVMMFNLMPVPHILSVRGTCIPSFFSRIQICPSCNELRYCIICFWDLYPKCYHRELEI